MKNPMSVLTAALVLGAVAKLEAASTTFYSESFEDTKLNSEVTPYIGGWFSPQSAASQWYGPKQAAITTGVLSMTSDSKVRSAAVWLPAKTFDGEGSYTLRFDVPSYKGDKNNSGLVTVWLGNGYDLSGKTGNALIMDTLRAKVRTEGSARAEIVAKTTIESEGKQNELTFDYDGKSAVILFFGAQTSGWPFPSLTYDDISISREEVTTLEPVPELSSALLGGIGVLLLLRRRR